MKIKLADLSKQKEIIIKRTVEHKDTGFKAELELKETAAFKVAMDNFATGMASLHQAKTKDQLKAINITGNEATANDYIMSILGDFLLKSWNIDDSETGEPLEANWENLEAVVASADENEGLEGAIASLFEATAEVLNEYRSIKENQTKKLDDTKKKPSKSTSTAKKQTN